MLIKQILWSKKDVKTKRLWKALLRAKSFLDLAPLLRLELIAHGLPQSIAGCPCLRSSGDFLGPPAFSPRGGEKSGMKQEGDRGKANNLLSSKAKNTGSRGHRVCANLIFSAGNACVIRPRGERGRRAGICAKIAFVY